MIQPLVSVLTPVYNGEKYLAECIESVMKQDYANWEYIIVNNCSTDKTYEIASYYAELDGRIRVECNATHVGLIENHNIALRCASQGSKYCKIVSADDWIYPECISKMVDLAENYPRVAIIGCYALTSVGVKHVGLNPKESVFEGKEVCRWQLMGDSQVMGAPTCFLYRTDVVREKVPFFPNNLPSADLAACYNTLVNHDFGFVHQILAYERIHEQAQSTKQAKLRAFSLDRLACVIEYGPLYLSKEEYKRRKQELLDFYYDDVLAAELIKCRKKEFWDYHSERLNNLGIKLNKIKLIKAAAYRIMNNMANPLQSIKKLREYLRA